MTATTITHRDVNRPAANETPAARMARLAVKAEIEGCRIIIPAGSPEWVTTVGVTSGSTSGLYYLVDLERGTCTCRAEGMCKHKAMVLMSVGMVPDAA
jgi:hypothetical protein